MRRLSTLPTAVLLAALAACTTDPVTMPEAAQDALAAKGSAGTGRTVVTEQDVARQAEDTPPTRNWVLYTRVASPGTGTFVDGPGTPPGGGGSLQLTTTAPTDKVYLFNFDHIGTALADIDQISYYTYRTAGMGSQVTALNIQVDYNGAAPGGFTTLVFEPVYNTDQGTVMNGVWQQWTGVGDAKWWSTRDIPGVCAFNCFVSWNDIVAANPDAVIVGGFGVNQGSGNPGLISAVDLLTLGYGGATFIYDFERVAVPSNKEQCKNGGWKTLGPGTGATFRNQGECVAFFNHV